MRREIREDYYRNKKDNDFLNGAIVGAAVVGIAVAIANQCWRTVSGLHNVRN